MKDLAYVTWFVGMAIGIVILCAAHEDNRDKIHELTDRIRVLESRQVSQSDLVATCTAWYFNDDLTNARKRICGK